MKKKIAIIFTGGTISMKFDHKISAAIPALSSEEIISSVTDIEDFCDIEIINFGSLPGPHVTPDIMMEISIITKKMLKRDDINGVIITHGTDSLEETAFLLDLTINSEKPVIVVGSMRNASELGYDGPSNLSSAICTCISDESKNKGVLVVMNNEVNSAREVSKTHTMSLNTFKSYFGPLGIVDNDEVIYYRNITKHSHIFTDKLVKEVGLIKSCSGMDGSLIDYLVMNNYKGIVVEAMGRGNLPVDMARAIKDAISKNIFIVIVSRCHTGRVLDSYGYEGGGKKLRNFGAIFSGDLNGQKARIKLMLALSITNDKNKIKEIFEKDYY